MTKRIRFINTRELKNKTNEVVREAQEGYTVVVTRCGKPVVTMRPFDTEDLTEVPREESIYQALRREIQGRYPRLRDRSRQEILSEFERITTRIREGLRFKSAESMDKAVKGDPYDLT